MKTIEIKEMPDFWYVIRGARKDLAKLLKFLSDQLTLELPKADLQNLLADSDFDVELKANGYRLYINFEDRRPAQIQISPNLSDEEAASNILSPETVTVGEKLKSALAAFQTRT